MPSEPTVEATTPAKRLPPEHPEGIKRVQVGCGPKHLRSDWWNTDLRKFGGIDEAMDAAAPWRWRGELQYVYAEHFLEHLSIEQAVAFIVEAGEALRKGGRIRLSTPSLEWVLSTHFTFHADDTPEHIAQTISVNRAFHGWGHRFLFSKGSLRWIFNELGFDDVKFFNYGESDDIELRNLELHGGWSVSKGFPSVWIIEGAKGERVISAPKALIDRLEFDFGRHVKAGH